MPRAFAKLAAFVTCSDFSTIFRYAMAGAGFLAFLDGIGADSVLRTLAKVILFSVIG